MTDIIYQDYVCHSSLLVVHTKFQEWVLSIISDSLLAFFEKFVSLQLLHDRDRRNSNRNGSVSPTLSRMFQVEDSGGIFTKFCVTIM
jgi:hypothetical protein